MPFIKLLFSTLILLQLAAGGSPPNTYPSGCYMSFYELRGKKPSLNCNIRVETKTEKAKLWLGSNDYRLVTTNESCILKEEIDHDMWAYCDSGVLYINCRKLKTEKQPAYANVVSHGRFLAFYRNRLSEEANNAMTLGGVLGGVVGSAIATASLKNPIEKDLYVIDMNNAKLFWVDSAYLSQTLKQFPDLSARFKQEALPNNPEAQLTYVHLMNNAGLK